MKKIFSFQGIFQLYRLSSAFVFLGILTMVMSSCSTPISPYLATPTRVDFIKTPIPQMQEQTLTPSSQRKGGWLDQIIVSVIQSDLAITQLKNGTIDIYANGLDSSQLKYIKDAGLKYTQHNGKSYALMFNPAVFADSKRLNPFSNRKIREAMNWLVDRDYINQEIFDGGGLSKFFAIQTNGPDYADLGDVTRKLETKYTYNLEMAKEVVSREMQIMGATLKDGKWSYKEKPVDLIFIIRVDDKPRTRIGDYVATQLEKVGFSVDRQYKDATYAAKVRQGPPTDGLWNLYTPVWISTRIDRDEKYTFQSMYLDSSGLGGQPFLSNSNADPEFKRLGDNLANAKFPDLATRHQMMARVLELSLQDSLQVWVIDSKTFAPYSQKLDLTYDLAAGVEIAQIWPYTLRFSGEGGQLRWATQDLFADPWNPIAGTNFDYDWGAIGATQSGGLMADPYTGLAYPLRIEKAQLIAQKGLPITKTLDWVSLKFEDEVKIPKDAFVDWDSEKQGFVTAEQIAPKIAEAKIIVDAYKAKNANISPKLEPKAHELVAKLNLTTINESIIKNVIGELAAFLSQLGGGDIDVITQLESDDGKAALSKLITALNTQQTIDKSALSNDEKIAKIIGFALSYVKVAAPDDAVMSLASRDYTGAKIKSIVYYPQDMFDKVTWHDGSKLTIADFVMSLIMTFDRANPKSRIYDSSAAPKFHAFMSSFKGFKIISAQPLVIEYYSDSYAQDAELNVITLWPAYGQGEAAWHEIAIANLAEENGELAYSKDKAAQIEAEQINLIGGPSIPIITKYLEQAANEGYIPYSPTLSQYITIDEAKARYKNLQEFFIKHGHYWIGTGPYILDKVFLLEKSLVLKNNTNYPDLASRWSSFGEPKIAEVVLSGKGQVEIGKETFFDVSITFKNQPYPATEIKTVKYLIYNYKNEVINNGEARMVSDGHYQIILPADLTAKFESGPNRIEVSVAPIPVSIPTFSSLDFIATK